MHQLLLVTTRADQYKSTEDAREKVFAQLENDQSFCGTGGRFGGPIADWFVIGGRWSGELVKPESYTDDVKKIYNIDDDFISESEINKQKKALEKYWTSFGNKLPEPLFRDPYIEYGYDDDCLLITPDIYQRFLLDYVGQSEAYTLGNCTFIDLEYDAVSPQFIGKKYLIVVDYHN